MFGKRTAVILGAGASYCYGGGTSGIPIQQNLIGKLFREHDTNSGEGLPTIVFDSGMDHSLRLSRYLRERFNIPEDPEKRNAKLDYWLHLQEKGFNLESLYSELEAELTGDDRILLDDFEAIVRAAVSAPTGERGIESVCPHHKRLCEALEPGDYIIDFNWDSVMVDTLLYCSHFWFPATGFGGIRVRPLLPQCQKFLPVESLVQLLPIHGSVVLFELDDPQHPNRKGLLFLGPRQSTSINEILAFYNINPQPGKGSGSIPARPELRNQEERIIYRGHIGFEEQWFKPLFIPPSKNKPEYQHWYFQNIRHLIHSCLPSTEHFVVAGYSFPEADRNHLNDIFVPGVIRPDAVVEIINPENHSDTFQQRVKEAFPSVEKFIFDEKDFRRFCSNLDIEYPDQPSLRPETEHSAPTD